MFNVLNLFAKSEGKKQAENKGLFNPGSQGLVESLKTEVEQLTEDLEKYRKGKIEQDLLIDDYSGRINKITSRLPPNHVQILDEATSEVKRLESEIKELRNKYISLQKDNQNRSNLIANMNNDVFSEIQHIRNEKYNISLNPEQVLRDSTTELSVKKNQLNMLNMKIELSAEKELNISNIERDYEYMNQRLEIVHKNLENSKNLPKEEKELISKLDNLKKSSERTKRIQYYRDLNDYEMKSTHSQTLIEYCLENSTNNIKQTIQ